MLGRLYPYYTRDILAGRTERTEVSGTGIEVLPECSVEFDAVPNLTEDFGRVCTEQTPPGYFGTYPTEHTLAIMPFQTTYPGWLVGPRLSIVLASESGSQSFNHLFNPFMLQPLVDS